MSIVYLTNSFPEPVESYVWEEIRELRTHSATVIPCSIRRPEHAPSECANFVRETRYAFPLQPWACAKASFLLMRHLWGIRDLIWRATRGPEPLSRKLRTLVHTWLGAYLAVLLAGKNVRHIHVHHGYFSAWVGMIAARILGAGFSMTLHGSDLLVRADYLDVKLEECRFCYTISDFNRQYILAHYPSVAPAKVLVQYLGIDAALWRNSRRSSNDEMFSILSVGRLHAIKNHGFLLLACHALKNYGQRFRCAIAGDGEERVRLEHLISALGLERQVTLLGHVQRQYLPALYAAANVVVLTSHSEGVPVTLMEAMAMERLVVAPRISGIPELVTDGENGFLYDPNSMDDFLDKLQTVIRCAQFMENVRCAARQQIVSNFNSRMNLADFAIRFLQRLEILRPLEGRAEADPHENPVLQQIELPLQRH